MRNNNFVTIIVMTLAVIMNQEITDKNDAVDSLVDILLALWGKFRNSIFNYLTIAPSPKIPPLEPCHVASRLALHK